MKKILITDDSKLARTVIKRELLKCFNSDTVELLEASSGKEAIVKLTEKNPDIMFLDLTMPDMDGFEVLEKVSSMNVTSKIFILSADIQEYAKLKTAELGATDFIEKPINAEKLMAVLKKHGEIQ